MDTRNDYRVLLLEKAIDELAMRIKNWSLPFPINKGKLEEMVKQAKNTVYRIKYSFLPAKILLKSPDIGELEKLGKHIREELFKNYTAMRSQIRLTTKQRLIIAEIKYCLWMIMGFRRRLRYGDENLPEYAVDVIGVEVLSVQKHPSASNLKVLKAGTEKFGFIIVTNIKNIKAGEVRAIAILPPREFMGIISEAMIVSDVLDNNMKGKFVPYSIINLNELRSKVIELIESH